MTEKQKFALSLSPNVDYMEQIVTRLELWLEQDDISRIPRSLVKTATAMLSGTLDSRKAMNGAEWGEMDS